MEQNRDMKIVINIFYEKLMKLEGNNNKLFIKL